MAYDGTNNFSQWDVTRPANTEQGNVLGIAIQEVKRVTQAVVEAEHNSDGTHQEQSIIQAYIADSAVGTTQIADGSVTAAKLATGIVDSSIIADGAVGTNQIADDAVTAAKLATGSVATANIQAQAITAGQLGGATAGVIPIGQAGGGFLFLALSGALTVNATTGQVTLSSEVSVDIAIIQDIKGVGVDGGTFTSGALQTRDLNSISDPGSIVTLSANKFSLPVGQYVIWAEVPAYVTGDHQAILYDETNNVVKMAGGSCGNANLAVSTSRSVITGFLDLSAASSATQFSIKHQCDTTQATNGFGKSSSFATQAEVYTQVMIISIGT